MLWRNCCFCVIHLAFSLKSCWSSFSSSFSRRLCVNVVVLRRTLRDRTERINERERRAGAAATDRGSHCETLFASSFLGFSLHVRELISTWNTANLLLYTGSSTHAALEESRKSPESFSAFFLWRPFPLFALIILLFPSLPSPPCPGVLFGTVSSATSSARPPKPTNATTTSGSPRWRGTATSAPLTPSLWPWLWTPAAGGPSWCCPWARWVSCRLLFEPCLALLTVLQAEALPSCLRLKKEVRCWLWMCLRVTVFLRSFHHIRSSFSAQTAPDVASDWVRLWGDFNLTAVKMPN